MAALVQGGLFLVGMGLGIAATYFILPSIAVVAGLLWVVWIILALLGVFMIIKSKSPTGITLLGLGLGVATTQTVFPKLIGTPVEGFFWISWFVLQLVGIIIIIWSVEH